MSDPQLVCQSDRRRADVRARGRNGIDYIETEVGNGRPVLLVHFLQKAPESLQKANIRITGGRRIRDLQVQELVLHTDEDEERDDCLRITLNKPGDLSTYRLCLVKLDDNGKPTDEPLEDFDRRYACLDFSFAANCPSDLDCRSALSQSSAACPAPQRAEPEINYLAKDYASFRQLILDRLALLMPDWHERHVPDLGITLVELLAYVGDYLSYYQDAVATEAYLDTARRRISVRRHARLVDYLLHEGCNARTWVCVQVEGDEIPLDPNDAYFVTGRGNALALGGPVLNEEQLQSIPAGQYDVFEALTCETIHLHQAHNKLSFYTWGDSESCVPKGATRATLRYAWQMSVPAATGGDQEQTPTRKATRKAGKTAPAQTATDEKMWLKPGDVLIFEEVIGPKTGNPADADPRHRHAVRLTGVKCCIDDLYEPPVQLVEIEWDQEDALPFAFCISAPIGPDCHLCCDISVARGNAILIDHGRSVEEDDLITVPPSDPRLTGCEGEGRPRDPLFRPMHFEPTLLRTSVTHRVPLADAEPVTEPQRLGSARKLLGQDPHMALPALCLSQTMEAAKGAMTSSLRRALCLSAEDTEGALCWEPRQDLISSGPDDRHFVAEIDNEGLAHLRFGDGELGHAPQPGVQFRAHYRVGNGVAGNVGAGAIAHVVYRRQMITGVSGVGNPLPAQGGVDPQPMTEARLFAPQAFRNQLQRAITSADYAHLAQRNPNVQNAAGSLHWNGSWYTMQVAVDPFGQEEVEQTLLDEIERDLHDYRRIGHDLAVAPARYAPLELTVDVCVKPHYLRGHVKAALLELFSNRRLPDGRLGFFHPDNLTFGEGIYVSELVALAQGVPGVESMQVTTLKRQGGPTGSEAKQTLKVGVLKLGPLEIAQLDNDPAQPENGKLILNVGGGR